MHNFGGLLFRLGVDDLPGAVPVRGSWEAPGDLKDLQKINQAIPRILKSHDAPAIGFVNEWKLQVTGERDARVALLQSWLDVLGGAREVKDELLAARVKISYLAYLIPHSIITRISRVASFTVKFLKCF